MPASWNEAKSGRTRRQQMHLTMTAGAAAAADTGKSPCLLAAAAVMLTLSAHPASAAGTTARDCISFEETDVDDALTYHNDCNRTVIFYYCVVDPQRTEVAPCRRVLAGTRRVRISQCPGPDFPHPGDGARHKLRHQAVGWHQDQMGGMRCRTRRPRIVSA